MPSLRDFDAPLSPSPRPADSSAATIAANGLLLLAQVDPANATNWSNAAIQILQNVTSLAWDSSWQSLLSNGTVNWPENNFLTGIVYGDYYYITAANMLVQMGLAECKEVAASNSTPSAASNGSSLARQTSWGIKTYIFIVILAANIY
ncbi:hypothetical protein GGU10DRAFT_390553 [Lentinula aff. detonsa]|uniref:Six-hairpin glycosidase n=1 Tax=Lentinula aff. detonsa TaxID=2804958 RepID=A0AA38KLE9_9AGAR|nr:hypothetical protein GGU10DRAFT_390553 [Lentinula aff. detonsa]